MGNMMNRILIIKKFKDGYQWEEPSDYSLVACGMNEDKDEIIMYWVE